MRLRFPLFALLFIAGSLAMPHFVHAGIPFFGPIIDKSWTVSSAGVQCALGWGAFMTVINNIIQLLITLAIVFVAPLMIAWAGFLMVVNQGNAGKLTEAKGILIHTVVGIVLALASWMIVDAVMAVLYNPATAGSTWSSLIGSSGLVCLPQQGVGTGLNPTTISPPGLGVGTTLPTDLSTSPGSPCNPATITAATSATQNQAKLLACVAQGESTCGSINPPYTLNYSWNKDTGNGKASTAAGAYQVLLSTNSDCYDNSVCEQAGGSPGVALNCKSGFGPNGFTAGGNSTVLAKCLNAAGNVSCSAAAAVCLLNKQSFSSAYATDPYTASCLSRYPN